MQIYILVHFARYSALNDERRSSRQLIASSENGTLRYIHQDSLSSTSLMTDTDGYQIDTTMKYYPYGGIRSGSVPTDKLFTGQRLDGTGLYYYNARYYEPAIGRFISPDTIIPHPANPQSFNRYSYCLNNPLKYVDRSGNWPFAALALLLLVPGAGEILIAVAAVALYVTTVLVTNEISKGTEWDDQGRPRPIEDPDFSVKTWKPEDPIPPNNDYDPYWLVKLGLGLTGVAVAVACATGKTQEAEEPHLPLEKEINPSFHVTFSDRSSGNYTSEQITAMQQVNTSISSIDSAPLFHVTFYDGSSGYYTSEQISIIQQINTPSASVD
jgi:RHS repeat-associated protein